MLTYILTKAMCGPANSKTRIKLDDFKFFMVSKIYRNHHSEFPDERYTIMVSFSKYPMHCDINHDVFMFCQIFIHLKTTDFGYFQKTFTEDNLYKFFKMFLLMKL